MAILVELLHVCLVLARGDGVDLLALALVVAAVQEHKLSTFFHFLIEHWIGDFLAVKSVLLDYILVASSAFLESPAVVSLELEQVLAWSLLHGLPDSCTSVLIGWLD